MKNQRRQVKKTSQKKVHQNSFVVTNKITQLPSSDSRVIKKKGLKIISAGDDNLFPLTIANIVKGSSTLNSVITSISEYISSGVIVSDEKLKNKLENDLNKDYDYSEMSKRVAKDYKTFGYAFLESVSIGKETFIYHLPASKVRFLEYEGNKPTDIAISKDWSDNKEECIEVALFPEQTDTDLGTRSIIHLSDYDVCNFTYSLPIWIGAIYDAQNESLISQYNANQFENGVNLSSILMFDFGDVTDEDDLKKKKTKLERQIKGTSEGRSGKSLIVPVSGEVTPPEYIKFPIEKEGSFEKLQETTENNIIKANQWFRSLAGLQTAGSLGNNQQLRNEWSLAERLISNLQFKILKATVLLLGDSYSLKDVTINNDSPIDIANDLAPENILTMTEKRAVLGLESIDEKDVSVALNGAQVTSLVDVVKAFGLGEISENQAVSIVKVSLGISEDEAKSIIKK